MGDMIIPGRHQLSGNGLIGQAASTVASLICQRYYMPCADYAVARCLSVCLPVCQMPVLSQNG